MSKWRRRILWSVIGVVAIVGFVLAYLYWLATSYPDYWKPPVADEAMTARADLLERTVTSRITRVRPDEEDWTLELDQRAMNEWFASRMRPWLANQGATDLSDLLRNAMVVLRDGEVELAVEANVNGTPRLIRFVLTPLPPTDADDASPARIALAAVYLGELSAPQGVLDMVGEQLGGDTSKTLDDLRTGQPLVFELGDNRTVTVRRVTVKDGVITFECRTKFVGKRGRV